MRCAVAFLDVIVLVLACAAFGSEHAAAVENTAADLLDNSKSVLDERQCQTRSEPLPSGLLGTERPEPRQTRTFDFY
jgi:hypothetical protein